MKDKFHKFLILITIFAVTSIFILVDVHRSHSQALVDTSWSKPIKLFSNQQNQGGLPFITSDVNGGLHVYWTVQGSEEDIDKYGMFYWVDYVYWNGEEWSEPLDVFVGNYLARSPKAVIDSSGIMHTVWVDDEGLKYAPKDIRSPISAKSWTPHVLLIPGLSTIGPFDLYLNEDETLHLLYRDLGAKTPGYYYLRSQDGGLSWDLPRFLSIRPSKVIEAPQEDNLATIYAENKTIYAAWGETDQKIYFSKSQDNGETWDPAVEIATGKSLLKLTRPINSPLILLSTGDPPLKNDICFKVQNTYQKEQHWDTGKIILSPPIKGCLGMDVDAASNGDQYLVTAAYLDFQSRNKENEVEGMGEKLYYSQWKNNEWTYPTLILWDDMFYEDLGIQPDFPSIAISEGNILNVVFQTFDGNIWFTRKHLDAPYIAGIPYEPLSEQLPVVGTQEIQIYDSPSTTPTVDFQKIPKAAERNPLVLSIVPVVILLAVIIFINYRKKTH
jgi:hypothetical protein